MTSEQYSPFVIKDGIDIGSLLAAYDQFKHGLNIAKSDLEKAGVIQYFEFTYELAWKTLKIILSKQGKNLNSPRPVFREAALEGLIDDPEVWFSFIEDRNETTHLYNKQIANNIYKHLSDFDREMNKLIIILKNLA